MHHFRHHEYWDIQPVLISALVIVLLLLGGGLVIYFSKRS